jgi:hypothetical protein
MQPVFAADAIYRLLHGEQDVIVLGQFTSQEDGLLEMRVIRTFLGNVSGDAIHVQDDFIYFGFTEESGRPNTGDYAVLSLNRSGELYHQAWHMARADSGHMRALTLYFDPAAGPGPPDLKALQYFVNTNGRQTEFYFDGEQVFARRNLLSDVDLTDGLTAWVPETPADAPDGSHNADPSEDEEGITVGIILSALMIVFFVVVIYIRLRAVFLTVRRQKKTA